MDKTSFENLPLELIEWRDAGGEGGGWLHPNDVDDENPIIRSIGWVVKETQNNVTLAMDLADDGDTNTRGRIPKGMIIRRININLPEM